MEVFVQYLAHDEICCVKLNAVCRRYFVFAKSNQLQVEDEEVFLCFLLSKPVVEVEELKA